MKGLFRKPAIFIVLTFLIGFSTSSAQVPDPADVMEMAIYRASVNTSYEWPEGMVNFDITDPDTINALLTGIESDTLRNCKLIKADNDAYIYIKFQDGTVSVYHLFFLWSHFAAMQDREHCYYVYSENRERYRRYAQE
ncbi:MAG: hypothetical protein KAX38_02435 [Candidatus Krumholzibacteria bacterium]|nr:hypothetical protein [Candidatus Krumholzibacteria bacterium]